MDYELKGLKKKLSLTEGQGVKEVIIRSAVVVRSVVEIVDFDTHYCEP